MESEKERVSDSFSFWRERDYASVKTKRGGGRGIYGEKLGFRADRC